MEAAEAHKFANTCGKSMKITLFFKRQRRDFDPHNARLTCTVVNCKVAWPYCGFLPESHTRVAESSQPADHPCSRGVTVYKAGRLGRLSGAGKRRSARDDSRPPSEL